MNDILDGDGSASFGQRIRSDNVALRDLYELMYFDFGLTPLHRLKENQFVPMTVGTTWGSKIFQFEIRGNIGYPGKFLEGGWGSPFNKIHREIPLTKNRVWAYDVTRLGEGILAGTAAFPGDAAYAQSEEYLKILQIIGGVLMPILTRVPTLHMTFDTIWDQFRIPDSISISMSTVTPLYERHLQDITARILHAYNRSDAPPVTTDYSMNPMEGTITLTMRDSRVQQMDNPEGLADFITNLNDFVENPDKSAGPADDGFPYEFYRGLGLIDDEDMVLVTSIFGADYPMRMHMTNELAREQLLSHNPES